MADQMNRPAPDPITGHSSSLEAIKRRLERNEHRRMGDDWHAPQDLEDITALVTEVERLRKINHEYELVLAELGFMRWEIWELI